MKKLLSLTCLIMMSLCLVACTKQAMSSKKIKDKNSKEKVITVATYSKPTSTFLDLVKDNVKEKGYTLKVVMVSDYIQANIALENKEHDANLLQHEFFMSIFNKENDGHLVSITPIYHSLAGFYGQHLKNIAELKDGAKVATPSDPANMTRALLLLQEKKLITLKNTSKKTKAIEDIITNPKKLRIEPVALLNLNQAYFEYDLVFNFPGYVTKINLVPKRDRLLYEKKPDIRFAGALVAREDNKNSDKIKVLKEVLTSKEIRHYITKEIPSEAAVAF
ncbi:TPA: MetQ/NlpA family ABC transporter substrate-binding protein [Streptococcus agalactiae]